MLILLWIAIGLLFYVNYIGRKNFKLLKYGVEILDQKSSFCLARSTILPDFYSFRTGMHNKANIKCR